MTELDFDELDKAVNSLMTNVDTSKRNPALDDPEDTVVALSLDDEPTPAVDSSASKPTVSSDSTSSAPLVEATEEATDLAGVATLATEPVVVPAPVENSKPTASLAIKRRGQFMDMIHPSSDMKSAPKITRREGVVISPSSAPGAASPVAEKTQTTASAPTVTEPETPSTGPEPQSSPFLSGTKPEKRPLGGVGGLEIPEPIENTDDTAVELQTLPAPDAQVLPEELSNDVLAVESNDLSTAAVEEKPVADTIEAVEQSIVEAEPEPAPAQTVTETPAGGSISQQYTEEPSTGDQTSGSIYDTANYHQAIESAKPAKKSSPLKWIILIITLLVVGGGVGVGYFLLTH